MIFIILILLMYILVREYATVYRLRREKENLRTLVAYYRDGYKFDSDECQKQIQKIIELTYERRWWEYYFKQWL